MSEYFKKFEGRKPPAPLTYNPWREALWQFLAVVALVIGAWYIQWRWTDSLNWDAMWFSLPLVLAETFAFIGMILFVYNLWKDQEPVIPDAPKTLGDIYPSHPDGDALITVDVMFATYDEDPELVRLGILDAKKMAYPYPININIHILDDGKREAMKTVAESEGVGYFTRDTNEGFKAGNLRNAMEQTHGDLIVICDADMRPFPTFLQNTLGYFRDEKMAWVQTPQWFYDLPEGTSLTNHWTKKFGERGGKAGSFIEKYFGKVTVGDDPFVNDPKMFYDVILRRRNRANASFCCGAGSIQRREAVMEAALRQFGKGVERRYHEIEEEYTISTKERQIDDSLRDALLTDAAATEVLTPYRFHVSEDIYTSIVLHSDEGRGWKSYMHPFVESKMLSPQDLLTWTIQRFKYAGGSLDILFNDNPLFRKGMKLPTRMMYAATFYSYLAPLWNLVFLFAPAIYLLFGVAPVDSYSSTFFLHIVPFLFSLELAMMVGTWGMSGYAAKTSYLAFFPLGLRAIWTVVKGEKIAFKVTPKTKQSGNFYRLVWPQISVVAITVVSAFVGIIALTMGSTGHNATGVFTNILWGINNIMAMMPIIYAANFESKTEEE